MAKDLSEGDKVRWNRDTGSGRVAEERYTDRIMPRIAGTEITRNGTEDEPAFLIERKDGGAVLKAGSELERV